MSANVFLKLVWQRTIASIDDVMFRRRLRRRFNFRPRYNFGVTASLRPISGQQPVYVSQKYHISSLGTSMEVILKKYQVPDTRCLILVIETQKKGGPNRGELGRYCQWKMPLFPWKVSRMILSLKKVLKYQHHGIQHSTSVMLNECDVVQHLKLFWNHVLRKSK